MTANDSMKLYFRNALFILSRLVLILEFEIWDAEKNKNTFYF